jgi:hypothetical protein
VKHSTDRLTIEHLNFSTCEGPMKSDVHKITDVTISTISTEPLTGILEVDAGDRIVKFEITEHLAHLICTDLERFLTR